jgi:hypothetical protein
MTDYAQFAHINHAGLKPTSLRLGFGDEPERLEGLRLVHRFAHGEAPSLSRPAP